MIDPEILIENKPKDIIIHDSIAKDIVGDIVNDIVETIVDASIASKRNITLQRLKANFKNMVVNVNTKTIQIDEDKYYYKKRNGNYYIGVPKNVKSNKYDAIKRLKSILKYNEIIVANDFKEVGIVEVKYLNLLKDISGGEVITSYNNKDFFLENMVYSFYLDKEVYIKKDRWLDNNIMKVNKALIDMIDDIILLCRKALDYTIKRVEIYFAEASGDDEKSDEFYKVSYHIALPIYTEQVTQLYEIFAYLNYNIFSLEKYSFKSKCMMDIACILKIQMVLVSGEC